MPMTLIEAPDAATATAAWWTRQLGAPRFDNGGDGVASMLATLLLATQSEPGQDKYETFAMALREAIQEKIDAGFNVMLDVDYHPDRMLTQAAVKAGIDTTRFPWKSHTHTTSQVVVVSLGYGARDSLVWKDPAFQLPVCGNQQYNNEGALPWRCGLLNWHEEKHSYTVPSPLCTECQRPEKHYWHSGESKDWSPSAHEFQA